MAAQMGKGFTREATPWKLADGLLLGGGLLPAGGLVPARDAAWGRGRARGMNNL